MKQDKQTNNNETAECPKEKSLKIQHGEKTKTKTLSKRNIRLIAKAVTEA